MIKQQIGSYQSFVLELDDMVVVMGNLEAHREFLQSFGFEEHPETKEFVGKGAYLYAMSPEDYFQRFGKGTVEKPDLTAQATDGNAFYQIDGLPLAEQGTDGQDKIVKIYALDFETRTFIEEGVAKFRVG